MNTEIANSITIAKDKAQYDQRAKELLSHKEILAHILINTVDEFKGMDPKEAITHIEGEPYVSVVPVDGGFTNVERKQADGNRIVGLNVEYEENNECLIRYDIICYVRMQDGISQIIINVEAQKDEPNAYDILNRAIFYVCRLISSQKEREFVKMEYNNMRSVISIWLCFNMDENSLDTYRLKNEKLLGNHEWSGNQDLIKIVLIGISNEVPERNKEQDLHRLLCTLFSDYLSLKDKLEVINREYQIPITEELRKDVNYMCNLSDGIYERGYNNGYDEGCNISQKKLMLMMCKKGYSLEQISDLMEISIEEVEMKLNNHKELVSVEA